MTCPDNPNKSGNKYHIYVENLDGDTRCMWCGRKPKPKVEKSIKRTLFGKAYYLTQNK